MSPQSLLVRGTAIFTFGEPWTRSGGARCYAPPLWPSNKALKPNSQFILSQTTNGCSLISLILAKFLLLDLGCEITFALSTVTALTACPFSIKKCAKMSVFYVKIVKIRWQLGATPPDPLASGGWGGSTPSPWLGPLPFAKTRMRHCAELLFFPPKHRSRPKKKIFHVL